MRIANGSFPDTTVIRSATSVIEDLEAIDSELPGSDGCLGDP
ncbi:hypothetical protein D8I24_3565 [Cupriavidus necator H850]|nr:hypothetical protein D8I24_3565 [Cupriavidus necator H850]